MNAAKPPEAFREIGALTIPRVDAQNVTLPELLEWLSAQIRQLDPSEQKGISIFATGFDRVNSDNDTSDAINMKRISYSAEDVRLDAVLSDLGRMFNVGIHVTSVGIVVTPPNEDPFPNFKAETGDVHFTYK